MGAAVLRRRGQGEARRRAEDRAVLLRHAGSLRRPGRLPRHGAAARHVRRRDVVPERLPDRQARHASGRRVARADARRGQGGLRLGRGPAAGPRRPGRHLRAGVPHRHRRGHRAQQRAPERRLGAGEVPDDRHRGGRPLRQRHPQRALHVRRAEVARPGRRSGVPRLPLDRPEPAQPGRSPSNNGGQYINSFGDFSQSVEAGRTKNLHKALQDLDDQIDADNVQSEN